MTEPPEPNSPEDERVRILLALTHAAADGYVERWQSDVLRQMRIHTEQTLFAFKFRLEGNQKAAESCDRNAADAMRRSYALLGVEWDT